ncbi:polysaccharide biosynthesis/export family protein [Spirochaeta isovalerica]|uniref:Protein involved in polysaccharide export with SLBB domain n=1 Tax=Spirochaeta isovalerica TaxID=150 RepID=A0A841R784_9SPIO|nr:polysaccharide biosynthesis/export family protein [Spirochaeta isovalerica]MBB6479241.1 protein involved in polysaccharide export with SLBB domain [Spirochaeta isovalerica]
MKKLIPLLIFTISTFLWAQQFTMPGAGEPDNGVSQTQYIPQAVLPLSAVPETAENLQLAISNRQYPVTPGDVYELTFLLAGETVSNILLVESDYTINMTIFGKLNASGMTFAQLKPVIEQKIADAYPRSLPSLNIISVGVFQVPVRGEIPESRYVTAWGLSRLSEVLDGILGDYSSVRDIQILSRDGVTNSYDLLLALNQGDLAQNPTIRPDDTIIINRIHREIEMRGEVYKPGVYQLLDSDTIDHVERYTGGFTPMANAERIRIDRFTGNHPSTFFINREDYSREFEFHNGDIVTVPSIIRVQPVVYVEGGILNSEVLQTLGVDTIDQIEEYDRISYPISLGETLYDILDSLRDSFAPFASLRNGYILRDGVPIAVNMERLIYNYDIEDDVLLEPFDQIIIPVNRPLVYVTGAANFPGPFPYNPNADYIYYVNQAGGFDNLRNKNGKVIITDSTGSRKSELDSIEPGDTINAISNDFLYNFNQYFPAIATGLGLITTMISIATALNYSGAE